MEISQTKFIYFVSYFKLFTDIFCIQILAKIKYLSHNSDADAKLLSFESWCKTILTIVKS